MTELIVLLAINSVFVTITLTQYNNKINNMKKEIEESKNERKKNE